MTGLIQITRHDEVPPKEEQGMRKIWKHAMCAIAVLAVCGGSVCGTLAASERDDDRGGDDGEMYAIGLWGDLPYSEQQATIGVPNLVDDMNRQHLAFSVHDGDLKQGNGDPTCSDAFYAKSITVLNMPKSPAMFTPGDTTGLTAIGRTTAVSTPWSA